MAAARANFDMWRGAAQPLDFLVTNSVGVVQDVSGWTAMFTMRASSTAADPPVLSLSAVVLGAGTDGTLRVSPAKADTLSVAPGRYVYTLERTNSGQEQVLTYGVVTVRADVNNAVA